MTQRRLTAMIGDYPCTRALRTGEVHSDTIALDFADVKVPSTAFKRVVRNQEAHAWDRWPAKLIHTVRGIGYMLDVPEKAVEKEA